MLNAPGLEGIALRYGFFYGPGTYHDPATGSVSRQVREQQYPVIGTGQGVSSFVHVEDAAAATVAALEADPGVYNVVDDDPSEMSIWLPAFARFLGAPTPQRLRKPRHCEPPARTPSIMRRGSVALRTSARNRNLASRRASSSGCPSQRRARRPPS